MSHWDKESYETYWDGVHNVFSSEEAAQKYYDEYAKKFNDDDSIPYMLSETFEEYRVRS